MSDRYELGQHLDKLRATLARAERRLHLAQPVRSADLYREAVETVDVLIRKVEDAISTAESTRPDR